MEEKYCVAELRNELLTEMVAVEQVAGRGTVPPLRRRPRSESGVRMTCGTDVTVLVG